MRDFFITSLEKVINVIVVLGAVAVLVAAGAALIGGGPTMGPGGNTMPGGGVLAALAILVAGGIYIVLVGGFMYLGLGIYQNTRRTAEAVEKLAGQA